MVPTAIAQALVIHLAIGTLEAIGTTALVVARVAVTATDGAAPAAILTRPRRAWIKFDIAEGTCGRQARRGEKLGRFACFGARPRNLN